jgi:hypothetical protein
MNQPLRQVFATRAARPGVCVCRMELPFMAQVNRPPVDEAEGFVRARGHVYGELQRSLRLAYPLPKDTTDADQKFKLLLEAISNCCPPDR